MKTCDVFKLQSSQYEDPSFMIDYYNVGRGFINDGESKIGPHIVKTIFCTVWRIVDDSLVPAETIGLFLNSESYVVEWTFQFVTENNEQLNETIFFYWKGSKAPKGLSPLPPNCKETCIVNRIVQWSEPAVFFHIFSKPIVVFDSKYSQFNPNKPHLFVIRGELLEELHLYEVPYLKNCLRSRGAFLIINPKEKSIFIWSGSKITQEFSKAIEQSHLGDVLKNYEDSWKDFKIAKLTEGEEDSLFEGDNSTYWHINKECNYTPRLFYMNCITGEFLATEVEYPLRRKDCIAAFPFLQSHLNISEDQPGYFLLDNHYKIWLISTGLKPSKDVELLYKLASETASNYAKEKGRRLKLPVVVESVQIGSEPMEFTNTFPYWN